MLVTTLNAMTPFLVGCGRARKWDPMDETDIQRFADLVLVDETIAHIPPEDRARLGYDIALAIGTKAGLSDAGTKELAALVKRRIEWSLFARRKTMSDSDGHT